MYTIALQKALWSLNHYLNMALRRMCDDQCWGVTPYQQMTRLQGLVWALADRAGYDIFDA